MPCRSAAEIAAVDTAHVWHPYAPIPPSMPPLLVRSAEGVRLRLDDGRELIDGMSSWWAAIHGYRHPVLDAAARDQLDRMSHVMFGGLTHEPAITLAERLIEIAPAGLDHVFFCDSGSVAVEVAIKMAVQSWQGDRPAKARLLTIRGGYHGDTIGAMSVCDPVDGMHSLFAGLLPQQLFAPMPPGGFEDAIDEVWRAEVTALVEHNAGSLAAVIIEPVVQGAGGMRFYNPEYVRCLRELCDAHDILLIFDEIATGFGRSGVLFAAEHARVTPDILCVGKALTGGYLSMAATMCTTRVAQRISQGPGGAFMHGPTFMANPLAAAIAGANLSLLLEGSWQRDVCAIATGLQDGLAPAAELPGVAEVRVLGAIGVIELDRDVDMLAATTAAVAGGVWLRPFRNLIYTMPPYICSAEDIAAITSAAVSAAAASLAT